MGGGRLWIVNVGNRTLMRVDPEDGSSQVFGTPSAPTGVAFADGRVWVTYGFDSDPSRGLDVLDLADALLGPAGMPVPIGSSALAADGETIWIADPLRSTVLRYDLVSGQSRTVKLQEGSGPTALAVGDGTLWVAAGRQPAVFRIDTADPSLPVDRFRTGGEVPAGLTIAPDGTVWIVEREADSVIGLSASGTTRVDAVVDQRCDAPSAVEATDDAVWVSCSSSGNVVSLDPADGSIDRSLDVGGDPGTLDERWDWRGLGRGAGRAMRRAAAPFVRQRRWSRPLAIALVVVATLAACATSDPRQPTPPSPGAGRHLTGRHDGARVTKGSTRRPPTHESSSSCCDVAW